MIGITNGGATWDWQLKKFFAKTPDGEFWAVDIAGLKALVEIAPDQEAMLEEYKNTCETEQT